MSQSVNYVFPPADPVGIPIIGMDTLFPVRRVYCVGQNYTAHTVQMGANTRHPPFFFCKPPDALVPMGGEINFPPMTSNLQHEVELVVAIKEGGIKISPTKAISCIFGYAVGFDLTRRDLQAQARGRGQPWEMGKAFDQSAPISPILPVSQSGHPRDAAIWIKTNGETLPNGDISQMLWEVPEIISNLSCFVHLKPGDLIFTGTPSGAFTISRGDEVEGGIDGIGTVSIHLV